MLFIPLLAIGQVGIGTTNPDSSSLLDLKSTEKGFLPPRMADPASITNPATGLMIYNTTAKCMQINSGTPSAPEWACLNGGGAASGSGSGSAPGTVQGEYDLGGTELRFKSFAHNYTCTAGIDTNDNVWLWGNNTSSHITSFNGVVLPNVTTNSPYLLDFNDWNGKVAKLRVPGSTGIKLVLTNAGKLFVWGYNAQGQMGTGASPDVLKPNEVNLPTGVTKVTDITHMGAYYFYAIIGDDGKAYFKGAHSGDTTTTANTFVTIAYPAGVGAGFKYTEFVNDGAGQYPADKITFIRGNDGNIYAVGDNNIDIFVRGATNNIARSGSYTNSNLVTKVEFPAGSAEITKIILAGAESAMALDADGKVYAWGAVAGSTNRMVYFPSPLDPLANNQQIPLPTEIAFPVGETKAIDISWDGTAGRQRTVLLFDNHKVYFTGWSTTWIVNVGRTASSTTGYVLAQNISDAYEAVEITINSKTIMFRTASNQLFWLGEYENNAGGLLNDVNSGVFGDFIYNAVPVLHGINDINHGNLQVPN